MSSVELWPLEGFFLKKMKNNSKGNYDRYRLPPIPLDLGSVPEYEDVAGGGVCEHRYEVGDGESPHLTRPGDVHQLLLSKYHINIELVVIQR